MIFICPSCGIRLEKDFKFCPNCGFDLSAPAEEQEGTNGYKDSDIVVCSNCGEENNAGNDFCTSCGAKLPVKGEARQKNLQQKTSSQKPFESAAKPRQANIPKRAKSKEAFRAPAAAAPQKSLSGKTVIVIAGVVVGIALLLMVFSGVFDSAPEAPIVNNQQSAPQGQSSGVDLGALEEINKLEAQIKANPNDTQALLHLAHLKNDAGLADQAIQNYKQYLEKNPSDADARVDMGVCYYNLKNYPVAIAEMKKALEYKPNHQIAHLNLGIVNLTAGNLEESKTWFKKAVDIDPNSEVGKRAQELLKSH